MVFTVNTPSLHAFTSPQDNLRRPIDEIRQVCHHPYTKLGVFVSQCRVISAFIVAF